MTISESIKAVFIRVLRGFTGGKMWFYGQQFARLLNEIDNFGRPEVSVLQGALRFFEKNMG